jgi:DNA damage-inducible protein 1
MSDPEVQARIAEEIRLKNVQENYEMAVEHAPESFGRVVMLYIPMSVNGVQLQAFVDSGAQSTIMSVQCAERCGIMRLIDKRFAGIAKGVGSAKILGRVHQVPCTIGTSHVSMSFTIVR